jgi:hypothetical protein
MNNPMAQNVPTLPTPTALKAISLSTYRSNKHRRSGSDATLFTPYQMREVVILFQSFARFGEDGMELPSQPTILDMLHLLRQVDPAVPDFQRW